MVEAFTAFGIVILLIGVILIILEVVTPGFFIGILGTISIVMGLVMTFAGEWVKENPGLVGLLVLVSGGSAFVVNYYVYRRLGSPDKTATTSTETLVGMEGLVTRRVEPDNIRGKVKLGTQVWSAESAIGKAIDEGTRVSVIRAEGVHILVRPAKKL